MNNSSKIFSRILSKSREASTKSHHIVSRALQQNMERTTAKLLTLLSDKMTYIRSEIDETSNHADMMEGIIV